MQEDPDRLSKGESGITIFTIGHSTRTIERFIEILQAHSVTLLVDIRRIPRSWHNPQFNKDILPVSLRKARIKYVHDADLGGLRRSVKGSLNTGWENRGFRAYADYMQTKEFQTALDNLLELARTDTVAIMCAEGNPFRCHRYLVGDALMARGANAVEISSGRPGKPHEMTAFARVIGRRVLYPGEPARDIKTSEKSTKGKKRKPASHALTR